MINISESDYIQSTFGSDPEDPLGIRAFIGQPNTPEVLNVLRAYLDDLKRHGLIQSFKVNVDPDDPHLVHIEPNYPAPFVTLNKVVTPRKGDVRFEDYLNESI